MMWPPGFSRPSRSAAAIIDSPMRSLIEPPGLWLSSLSHSSLAPVSKQRTRTSGVFPISSTSPFAVCTAELY